MGMAIKVSSFSPEYQPQALKQDVGIMESGFLRRGREIEGGGTTDEGRGEKRLRSYG